MFRASSTDTKGVRNRKSYYVSDPRDRWTLSSSLRNSTTRYMYLLDSLYHLESFHGIVYPFVDRLVSDTITFLLFSVSDRFGILIIFILWYCFGFRGMKEKAKNGDICIYWERNGTWCAMHKIYNGIWTELFEWCSVSVTFLNYIENYI